MPGQRSTAVKNVVVSVLALLVVGYLVAVLFTKDIWSAGDGTQLTFTAQTTDGSAPSPDAVLETLTVLEGRLAGLGLTETTVVPDNGNIVATVANRDVNADAVRSILQPGRFHIRPVIQTMPGKARAQTQPQPKAPEPGRIADEKQLRQSTEQTTQVLALQSQATRCGDDDVLAGHDDPNLPLVTCSTDGQTVYLLDKSILGGGDVREATAGFSRQAAQHVVDMRFDEPAATMWADYTSDHVGTQTAITVDAQVLSAPQIREPILGGHTQITGDFDAESAHRLASLLGSGALPLTVTLDSSGPEKLSAATFFTGTRALVIVAGIFLTVLVVATAVYLARRKANPGF